MIPGKYSIEIKYNSMIRLLFTALFFLVTTSANCQSSDNEDFEKTTGIWYMLFYHKQFSGSQFGVQGDFQERNWDLDGDFEQRLIRNGLTFKPKESNFLFTLGYGNIQSGVFGSDSSRTKEHRIYQEALIPWKISDRVSTSHRYRFEQRWIEENKMKTRHRYNLFLNIALNQNSFEKGTIYLALYGEIFLYSWNIIVDRLRVYSAIGYEFAQGSKLQFGVMRQYVSSIPKNQLQLSLHRSIK